VAAHRCPQLGPKHPVPGARGRARELDLRGVDVSLRDARESEPWMRWLLCFGGQARSEYEQNAVAATVVVVVRGRRL
jgi:hypothetical protein